jgi:predicted nucleic acid-binding protein
MLRLALDTNVLAYAEGVNGPERQEQARRLIQRLPSDIVVVPVQALGELFHVLVRKAGRSRADAHAALLAWSDAFDTVATSPGVMATAAGLAATHKLGIWDAVMLASAASAGCRLLLSEDLQGGFTWDGVTVVDPFVSAPHPLLSAILAD